MSWKRIILVLFSVLTLGGIAIGWYLVSYVELDIYVPLYADNCAQCHGAQLEGTDIGPPLLGGELSAGDSVNVLQERIRTAHIGWNRLAVSEALTDEQIKGLAIYIGERRLGQRFTQFQFDRDIDIPDEVQSSEAHDFVIETVIDGLDPLVFSIEPLPDGSLLVTEKERGLSVISPDGKQSALIDGTPETGSSLDIMGIQYGSGWLLDVAIHPEFAENGWIYLHYTHLCGDECDGTTGQSHPAILSQTRTRPAISGRRFTRASGATGTEARKAWSGTRSAGESGIQRWDREAGMS
jgi:hypothetical protein